MLTASPAMAGNTAAPWAHQPIDGSGPASVAVAAIARSRGQPKPLIEFVEPAESFLSLSIRNFGLTLATLGFYSFWARADARRQLHRALRVGGQPLDYTGTGREAFVAFLLGCLTTTLIVSGFVYFFVKSGGSGGEARAALSQFRYQRLLITLPLLFLLGSVVYRKRKGILRRTWLRGQHFDLDGRPYAYALQHFWTAFLVPLTLGWAGPWRASRLEHRKIHEMHLGDQRFRAVGNLGALYRAFAALWFGGGAMYVGTMVVLGLLIGEPILMALGQQSLEPLRQPGVMTTGLWVLGFGLAPVFGFILYYRAAWIEHQISSLSFDGTRLYVRLPKARFAGLMLWNSFVKLVSFGAFSPVADAAMVRFIVDRITATPHLPLHSAETATATPQAA
jgi:uncharacterized membrane protein YjgN (DUF898 family)